MIWLKAIVVGLVVGAGARAVGLPCPAPNALVGSFVVVAITVGYLLAGLRIR